MAAHSNILACETPWREEPGRLQSMGLQRVGHELATKQKQYLTFQQKTDSLIKKTNNTTPFYTQQFS